MDLFDELIRMKREREARPLPSQSDQLSRYAALLPDASDLGEHWENVSFRTSEELMMRRTQTVYASKRYISETIAPFEQDGEQFSLEIHVWIHPSFEDALAQIGHIAINADEMKASEQWEHAFYGTLWPNCIVYPRDPNDFNDIVVAFPHDLGMWQVQSRGPHALRYAHFVHTKILDTPIPNRD